MGSKTLDSGQSTLFHSITFVDISFVAMHVCLLHIILYRVGEDYKTSEDGAYYATLFGPLCFAFSLMSMCIAKQSDENNPAKQLFAVSWLIYHITMTLRRIESMVGIQLKELDARKLLSMLFHACMTLGFLNYLISTNFDITTLFFW